MITEILARLIQFYEVDVRKNMGKRYFKSRSEAGQYGITAFTHLKGYPVTVIALSTDALTIGAHLSQYLQCPLQLYLSDDVVVPGSRKIGGVNSSGGFSYDSSLSQSETDYLYQEFHSYIEESKRTAFTNINRELGSKTIIRKDLIRNRNVVFVADALQDTIALDGALDFVKSLATPSVSLYSPIVTGNIVSPLNQRCDYVYFSSTVDFFYGKDHYFEDNKVYERGEGVDLVSSYLKLWPA